MHSPREDDEEARRLGLAASQGDAEAQAELGDMHYAGHGVPQDFAEARRLLGLAAAQGHAHAQASLGRMHYAGDGGPQDLAEARRLLGLAAAQGDAQAQALLGRMHYNGHGGPQDFAEARRLYGLAAAQGHAQAQARLGSMHFHGQGGPQDFAEARRLLELAAAQGHAQAQAILGIMHFHGRGGPQDFAEARRLLGLAAAQGLAEAQASLGRMHYAGHGGPQDFAEARRLCGLAAAQGQAQAQASLGIMHYAGHGGPEDFVEARRLLELAAAQGLAEAQAGLGSMHGRGHGGPQDFAEARRLCGLAAAQGHEGAQARLDDLDQEEKSQRAKQQADADAMMLQLLAEDAEEKKVSGAAKSAKSKKSKQSCASAAPPSAAAPAAPIAPPSSGATPAETAAASDAALREAMVAGELEGLSAALELHRALASEAVLREVRSLRDRLKERRKQKSQRQRRSHAGAMAALSRLQGCATDADALRAGIVVAEAHAGELPALDEELAAARARLEGLSIDPAASAAVPASEAAPPAGSEEASREFALEELQQATAGFDRSRLIGRGGFGQVFLGEAPASLAARQRLQRVAVKRADLSKLELSDLHREVAILRSCSHPHLLPLLGYCVGASAACLVFPLMVGGSLQTRLDLMPSDCEYLRRMEHFTAAPKPLTWRQKLRIVVQAVDALVYLHTPTEDKGCTWHRDFKPANILLDDQLNAFLGDTGFAKAAQKSGDRNGATTSVWGGAGSPGYCEDALRTPDEQTEAYSVGVTLLVVLTGHDPVDIEEACCKACEDIGDNCEFVDIPAERLAQPNAEWPAGVAGELKHCYMQLTNKRRTKRLTLAKLLQSLRALLETGGSVQTATEAVGTLATDALQKSTPLSLQVRRMRPAAAATRQTDAVEASAVASVQRNVAEAFDTVMRRLDELYHSRDADAPRDFERRLHFWRDECGLPSEAHSQLQTLRIWRNASLHHDADQWRQKGPSSAQAASEHLAALSSAVDRLCSRQGAVR